MFVINKFPQLMNVAFSPSFSNSASSPSIRTLGPIHAVFTPTSEFLGCFVTVRAASIAPFTKTGTVPSDNKAVYRGATGSII